MFISGKAKSKHIKLGKKGEKIALRFLKTKHMDILAENYRKNSGEIDIIARDGVRIVFVEVKTRRYKTGYRPSEGLTDSQKKRIIRTSKTYLREISNPDIIIRFDLIELVLSEWKIREIRHHESYFSSVNI